MKKLDVNVFTEAGNIKISLKQTLLSEGVELLPCTVYSDTLEKYDNQPILTLMRNKFFYDDPAVETLFHRDVVSADNTLTTTFTLPIRLTHPVLDFLNAVDNFVDAATFVSVSVNGKNLREGHTGLPSHTAGAIAQEILQQNAHEGYQSIKAAINKIIQWQGRDAESRFFIQGLELKNRFMILNDLELDEENAASSLQELARKMTTEDKSQDFTHLLRSLDREIKMELYQSFLDKHDDFSWDSLEWQFLRDAEFLLRSDGRISVRLDNNIAFQHLEIAPEYRQEVIETRLKSMLKFFDLKLEAESNFLKELVFTPQSSKDLMAYNLHMNKAYADAYRANRERNRQGLFASAEQQPALPNDLLLTLLNKDENVFTNSNANIIAAAESARRNNYQF